ncbi:pre-mRNA-processing factor 39-like [Rhinoderma darwinii]|uniref:pre-mRNA-processing factor 39-like n=1 Tax=Rhinoderma darwinii TaxID=43563 RepID=UPI003F67CF0F
MADNWRFQSGFSAGSLSISSQSSQNCDVLTTEDCSGSDDEDNSSMPPDFSSYWRAATMKPSDFTSWTKLVAYAEKEKNLAACRKAYDAFLMCFPLSHIYWRKYTDIEERLGSSEEAEKIFVRAVKSNPLNVTLWTSYILFLSKKVKLNMPEKLQGVFKDAIDACGMDFRSDELWSLYIEYEIKHGNFKEAMALYNRVLNIPTQRYQMHFERFKILVSTQSPIEFLTMDEINVIHAKIQVENDNDQIAAEDLPSGDIADSLTEIDVQKIRQQILETKAHIYLQNEVQVQNRCVFEDAIKRLYFLASPLNVKQLQNWRKYLDFEASQGPHERVVILYERCLMPCAMYEEFWLLYAQYMERHSVEAARSVFERACRIHLPLKFTLHLQWALFEEKHGQLDSARAILCNLENVLPGVVMVRLRRVNFERRNGSLQEAERLLREAAQNSSSSEMAAFYTVKLARLLLKLKRDPENARDVLIEALKKEPNSPYLYQCLLETEISRDAVDDAMQCVERALNSNIHDSIKGILSQRRLELLEDCGNSIKSLFNAYDEHQTLLKKQKDLKRKANDKNKEDQKVTTQSANPSVKDNISIPGVSRPTITSVAPSLVSTQSAAATNSSTTVSFTQKTIVKVSKSTEPVRSQPTPNTQVQVPAPRAKIRPYVPPHRSSFLPVMPSIVSGPVPQSRMSYRPPMPPQLMGGPHGPIPPYNYGPWFQNFGGYSSPQPWNYNQFYPPF